MWRIRITVSIRQAVVAKSLFKYRTSGNLHAFDVAAGSPCDIGQSDKFEDAVEHAEARHKTVTRTANIARRDAVIEQLLLDVIRPLETPHIYIGPGWACLPWNQLVLLDSNRQLPM